MKWDEVPSGVSLGMTKEVAMSLRGSRRGPFVSGMICGAVLILGLQSCVAEDSDSPTTKPSGSVSSTPTVRTTPTAQR